MFDEMIRRPDTADLITLLRLAPMNASTRICTIASLRAIRSVLGDGTELAIDDLATIVEKSDRTCQTALGERHAQILSDARRALRMWQDDPRQRLALRYREGLPTLADAVTAVRLRFRKGDRAARAEAALEDLAASQSTDPGGIAATSVVIAPILNGLSPEDLGVQTRKSLDNKLGLIRAAVRLVDPITIIGREADTKTLSPAWQRDLAVLKDRTPAHAEAVHAIFRRLAIRSDRAGTLASELSAADLGDFVAFERMTKAASHADKLGAAARIWNEAIENGELISVPFDRSRRVTRLPDVAWNDVPAMFREPVDALLETASTALGDGQWSDLIDQTADADLGVPRVDEDGEDNAPEAIEVRGGTARNWRDATKRIWHAAENDPVLETKPREFVELWDACCVQSFVRAAWDQRRKRIEAKGGDWEANKKGRYEITLIQTFIAVGKAVGVPEDRIEKIVAYSRKIDPSILDTKRLPDGSRKFIYEDRKIGPRHAEMLRKFNDDSVMRRWFDAPDKLWAAAMKGKKRTNGPTLGDVALARSALIARVAQRVSPLRRINVARLRCAGATAHIQLPVGDGEGRLIFPAVELKNLRRVEVRIDPETVKMIREFIKTFRPVSLKKSGSAEENEHLFPGAETRRDELGASGPYAPGCGYHTPGKLSKTFATHMRRRCNLDMDMHVMRHIAGKVILDLDPSAMALVQELLGHKRIETTRSYYAEVSQIVAQRRYLELLDRATRRAISNLKFDIEKLLEGK